MANLLDPALVTEPPGAELPTGAGTTKPAALPVQQGQIPPLALGLAAIADLLSPLAGGQKTNQLGNLLQFQNAGLAAKREERAVKADERKAATDEKRLVLDEQRLVLDAAKAASAEQREHLKLSSDFVTQASGLAGKLIAIPEGEQRTAAVNAMVAEARERGGEQTATIVQGILQAPDIGKTIGPYTRYLPEQLGPSLLQEGALLFHAGKGTEVQAKAEVLSLPGVTDALFSRIDTLSAKLREQSKGPIPIAVLEAAVEAANPKDSPGANPELNLLRGAGSVYGKAEVRDVVKGRLIARGFEEPGLAAKAAEAGATEAAKKRGGLAPDIVGSEIDREKRTQDALLPGKIAVSRAQGAAAAEVTEGVRRGRKVSPDAAVLIGLPKGTTIGQAEDQGIKVPEGPELATLKQFKIFAQQGQEVIGELDALIAKTPEAIGQSGRMATLAGGLQAQGQNFARLAGIQVDASLNPKDYAETFRGIGIEDAKIQSNIIALAFPLAVASQGGGGRLSDKDIDLQIKRIGAQAQDPVAFRAVLADVGRSLSASFDRALETATGRPPATSVPKGTGGDGEIRILRRRPK